MYKILSSEWISELELLVNDWILKGWTTCGGVCIVNDANGVKRFYQAIQKKTTYF